MSSKANATIYKQYKQLDIPSTEKNVLAYWKNNHVFEKSISNREGKDTYVFYEGPPSANGMPGIHHVISRSLRTFFADTKP